MFTSQSLRAIVRPGAVSIRENRLDDVVQQVEVRGTLSDETAPELARRIEAARPSASLDFRAELGPVIGTHGGPGTIGLFWFRD